MKKHPLSIGILSGGKSSRMGQDKALLQINSQQFLNKLVKEFKSFEDLLVSVDKAAKYDELPARQIVDQHQDIGPIEGIYQVISHADNEYVFVCAVDMPFVTRELAAYMAEFISSDYDCYCIRDEERVHPLCAIYSKSMLPVIEKLIAAGKYRLVDILNQVRTKYIQLEQSCFDVKTVKNINTRDEYRKLLLPVVFCVSGVKNSGKTWLIAKLINEFIKEHYQVAVIKHDGHDYQMDYENTDTFRFTQAGAFKSIIFSDTKYSMNAAGKKSAGELLDLAADADIIILEGMKDSCYPKVEVIRKSVSEASVCQEDTLICVAADFVFHEVFSCPVMDIDDIHGIFTCIKKFFGLELIS